MTNKKRLRQRKKKQLKKSLSQVAKLVNKQIDRPVKQLDKAELTGYLPYEEQKKLYQLQLDQAYNGSVVPLTQYVNSNAVLVHKCNNCGISFFARPSHMLGTEHQRHLCNMPLADQYGNRFSVVSGKKRKSKKSKNKNIEKKFNELIWNDLSPNEIAKELDIPVAMVMDYFVSEGLI